MLNPDDVPPPEVIELEREADARGYFASDEDSPDGDLQSKTGGAVRAQPSSRRR